MPSLKCKNCGGSIYVDDQTKRFVCDSCGASQSITEALSADYTEPIFNNDSVDAQALQEYRKALSRMERIQSENGLIATAEMFEKIPDILNSEFLAKECRARADLLQKERLYSIAIEEIESKEPQRVKYAISLLESISGYKDADQRLDECRLRLPQIEQEYEAYQKEQAKLRSQEEQQRQRLAKQQRRRKIRRWLVIAVVIAAIFIIYSSLYSSSNIKISIAPDEDSYVTTKYGDTVFNYTVHIQNNSFFDVSAIHADIYFEEPGGNVLIDTNLNIGNYGSTASTAVRAHKSSDYTWSVSVSSDDAAQKLYDYDFNKLDIKIKIKEISYTNGKKKSY